MNTDMVLYYKARADEYEKVYSKPERQNDLGQLTEILQQIFRGKEVFEIACGTGYWTERIAETARTILATDINKNVLDMARSKKYSTAKASFQTADIFNVNTNKKYESLFGGFIWSHIKLQELNFVLENLGKHVVAGGTMVFIDNKYAEGSSLPITDTDDYGNTYQVRLLENGSRHKVLKNFPSEDKIKDALQTIAFQIEFINL